MVQRVFDARSHAHFADLSGDRNPIHMDAVAARRTSVGGVIVHGIHSLLWLLDSVAKSGAGLPGATGLKVQFRRPIYVGDEASVELLELTAKSVRVRLLVEGTEAVVASITFGKRPVAAPLVFTDSRSTPMPPPTCPNDPVLDAVEGITGCLSFDSAVADTKRMFPSAASYFGERRIAALMCSSCIVGMIVPGLHSLFSALDVSFSDAAADTIDGLRFAVESVEPRFRLVRIGVCGGGLYGSLEALRRAPPILQPSMTYVEKRITKNEFRNSSALIVGGSRGLGELTAKIVAAGGGRVFITYAAGKTDADAVADEIRWAGGECTSIHYDARRPAAEQLSSFGAQVQTHIYYFATPLIFRRRAGSFDTRRFFEFNSFYVDGFFDLVTACLQRRPEGMRVFYPSSVFVDTRPPEMTEYAMSKAAAEILCADMECFMPGARIFTRRLPRLPTDQTSSITQLETADPIEVLLPIVREMHS